MENRYPTGLDGIDVKNFLEMVHKLFKNSFLNKITNVKHTKKFLNLIILNITYR